MENKKMTDIYLTELERLKKIYPGIDGCVWDRFLIYLQSLKKWNSRYNLTGFPEDQWVDRIIAETIVLSDLIPVEILEKRHDHSWFDMGTGAGIPGLLIASLFPDQQFVLIDSREKKTDFVLAATSKIGLKMVTVLTERLENKKVIQSRLTKQPNVFFSRALADPQKLIDYAERYAGKKSVIISPRSGSNVEKNVNLISRNGVTWKGGYLVKSVPISMRTVQFIVLRRMQ